MRKAVALGAFSAVLLVPATALAQEAGPPTTVDVETPAEQRAENNDDDSDNTGLWGLLGLLGLAGLAGLLGRKRNTADVATAEPPKRT